MSMNRRRFLTIAASFAATPALAMRHSWQGWAFGAVVEITLQGPRDIVQAAIADAREVIRQMEQRFSLYRATSELVLLNKSGASTPSTEFHQLMRLADEAYQLTEGLFDPTVQPLWQARAEGRDLQHAASLMGWNRVWFNADHVRLNHEQQLTFNGIAQGFATDAVTGLLADRDFDKALVNIGEIGALGGPWRLGIEDPTHGLLATQTLTHGAIATSSPMSTPLAGGGHILHSTAAPRWSTVSVMADSAAMADALSTGLVMADMALVRKVRRDSAVRRIMLIDQSGDLVTV